MDNLARLALIRINTESKAISLNRLVQESWICSITAEDRQGSFELIVTHLLDYFLDKEERPRELRRLEVNLPYVLEVLQRFKDSQKKTPLQPTTDLLLLIKHTIEYVHLRTRLQ